MKLLSLTIAAILIAFSSSYSIAQTISGRLYMQTSDYTWAEQGAFGYISYPDLTYQFIDSIGVQEFRIKNDLITTVGKNIYQIRTADHQIVDSLANQYVKRFDYWGDKLVTVHDSFPFFRVFHADLTLDFSLDSSLVDYAPRDVLVLNEKAYITLWDRIKVINLKTQDSVVTGNQTIDHNLFGVFDELFKVGDTIYTEFEWFTGAPWATTFEIDTDVDTLIRINDMILGNLAVFNIPAYDRFYVGYGLNYFDLVADTFINYNVDFLMPVAYDDASESLFAYNEIDPPSSDYALFVFKDSVKSDSVSLPNRVHRARFFEMNTNSIDPEKNAELSFSVYPNPANGNTKIQWDSNSPKGASISIVNLLGQKIIEEIVTPGVETLELNTDSWAKGVYYIRLVSEGRQGIRELVVE